MAKNLQTVKPVDEVHGVRHADDPQHRHGIFHPAERPVGRVGKDVGIRQDLDHHAVVHSDQRRADLHEEFELRAQRRHIVHHAEHHDDDRAEQDALHLVVDVDKEQDADHEAEEDRKPA